MFWPSKEKEPDSPEAKEAKSTLLHLSKQGWNEVYARQVSEKRNWRNFSYCLLLLLLSAIAGLTWQGTQSKIVPHVVVTNQDRDIIFSGIVTKASTMDEKTIKRVLSDFIEDFRLLSIDQQVMLKGFNRVYSHLLPNTPAFNKFNEFYNKNDPFELAEDKTRIVKGRISIMPITREKSKETWAAEWLEEERDKNGEIIENTSPRYKAVITIRQQTPKTDKQRDLNSFGVFILDIKWETK